MAPHQRERSGRLVEKDGLASIKADCFTGGDGARAWLHVECGNHCKLERGAASGSLHRLVRCFRQSEGSRRAAHYSPRLAASPAVELLGVLPHET